MKDESSIKEITVSLSALLAFVSVLSAPAIGYGIWTWSSTHRIIDRVERLEADTRSIDTTLTVVAEMAHKSAIHTEEHEKNANRWIDQIVDNTESIHELQRTPNARPDPFTGTEGRALRDRIERLERDRAP